jgi:hypothetical protein
VRFSKNQFVDSVTWQMAVVADSQSSSSSFMQFVRINKIILDLWESVAGMIAPQLHPDTLLKFVRSAASTYLCRLLSV